MKPSDTCILGSHGIVLCGKLFNGPHFDIVQLAYSKGQYKKEKKWLGLEKLSTVSLAQCISFLLLHLKISTYLAA